MISVPIATGLTLGEILADMDAHALANAPETHPERYMRRSGIPYLIRNPEISAPDIIADEHGRPRVVDRYPHPAIGTDRLINPRPPAHLFRAISEEDWENIQLRGFIRSDGRMNLMPTEGTVAAFEDPTFYLPGKLASNPPGPYPGRILRMTYDDSDGWRLDRRDGYAKTNAAIPIERVNLISPCIITMATVRRRGC